MRHNRFNLITRKEPPRACVAAVSECHAGGVAGDVLRFSFLRWVGGADVGEAEGGVGCGVWVESGVHGDGGAGNADCGMWGDDEVVGEVEGACYYAFEGYCLVSFLLFFADLPEAGGGRGEERETY